MKAALRVADYIHRDIYVGRASAWIYCFSIFTYKFKGSMGVLSPPDKPGAEGELIIPKRFWAMANYSQFVQPNWKVMKVEGRIENVPLTETNTTGFVSPKVDEFVIVAVNPGDTGKKVTCNFGKWFIGPKVASYCTSNDYDLAPNVVALTKTDHHFTATLPPKSVTTFKGKLNKP
jgi:O-glycosyl hydrolase